MRKTAGLVLILGGLAMIYVFAAYGAAGGGAVSPARMPFSALGGNFPFDALMLVGGLWGLGLGAWMASSEPDPSWRPMARFFLVNSLLLLTSLVAAVIGARFKTAGAAFAIFAAVALLQIGTGLILGVLAALERPRGIVSLAVGGALYVAAAAVTLICFLGEGA